MKCSRSPSNVTARIVEKTGVRYMIVPADALQTCRKEQVAEKDRFDGDVEDEAQRDDIALRRRFLAQPGMTGQAPSEIGLSEEDEAGNACGSRSLMPAATKRRTVLR